MHYNKILLTYIIFNFEIQPFEPNVKQFAGDSDTKPPF